MPVKAFRAFAEILAIATVVGGGCPIRALRQWHRLLDWPADCADGGGGEMAAAGIAVRLG